MRAASAAGGRHVRVDLVGHVEGDVAVALDQHRRACGRHGLGREALTRRSSRATVEFMRTAIQRKVLGVAAPRIGVELASISSAIVERPSPTTEASSRRGRGDQLAADDQQPVFVAAHEALDDHPAALLTATS